MHTMTKTLPIKSISMIEVFIMFLRNKILNIYEKADNT